MSLSKIQTDILLLLAKNRNLQSYVAGATALNQHGPRQSNDIDIFHDHEADVEASSTVDARCLIDAGYRFDWKRRGIGIHSAIVSRGDCSTDLEWVRDSSFRFFPAIKDPAFGYRLHLADLATNKVLAAAGRNEPRDILDLIFIHENYLPLGPVIWAAVAKDPGFSPENLVNEIRRNARYRQEEYDALQISEPVNAAVISRSLKDILKSASAFIQTMPIGLEGRLFMTDGKVVQPDASRLDDYELRESHIGGIWPSTSKIDSDAIQEVFPDDESNKSSRVDFEPG